MDELKTPNILEPEWEREVECYCRQRKVVSRRPPAFDRYVICSQGCWDKMVSEGNQEPGSLFVERS